MEILWIIGTVACLVVGGIIVGLPPRLVAHPFSSFADQVGIDSR